MRLTERDGDKVWFAHGRPRGFLCPRDFCDNAYGCDKVKDRNCPYLRLLDKLAAYEDAEEQGRLVILPCKVGDTVWRLATGTRGKRRSAHPQYVIYEFRISEVYGSKSMMFFGHNIIDGKISTSYEVFREDDFGKTVFLTREEAEAALKGGQDDV